MGRRFGFGYRWAALTLLLLAAAGARVLIGQPAPPAQATPTRTQTAPKITSVSAVTAAAVRRAQAAAASDTGIHKIKHVVIIMQENHSFDNYFGTYPGADGIPGLAGNPGQIPCIPDPKRGACDQPYHEITVSGSGGPHFNSLGDQ